MRRTGLRPMDGVDEQAGRAIDAEEEGARDAMLHSTGRCNRECEFRSLSADRQIHRHRSEHLQARPHATVASYVIPAHLPASPAAADCFGCESMHVSMRTADVSPEHSRTDHTTTSKRLGEWRQGRTGQVRAGRHDAPTTCDDDHRSTRELTVTSCALVTLICRPFVRSSSREEIIMGGPNNTGTGIRFCGFSCSWLQPMIILVVVTYIYCVYVGLNLLPALQSINASSMMSDEGTGFISGTPGFQSFVNDPHATKMTFTAFVIATLGFHVLLIMFALSFVKAIVTPPGSVPVEKQADSKVSEEDGADWTRKLSTRASGLTVSVSAIVLVSRLRLVEMARWSVRYLTG
jgi:hypothetical protein